VNRLAKAPTIDGSTRTEASSSFSVDLSSWANPARRQRSRREVNLVQKLFAALQRREEGQTMAEYGVVLAVITALVIGALTLLSDNIIGAVTDVANLL
jgi:Flp pilus assembly pilin Flp